MGTLTLVLDPTTTPAHIPTQTASLLCFSKFNSSRKGKSMTTKPKISGAQSNEQLAIGTPSSIDGCLLDFVWQHGKKYKYIYIWLSKGDNCMCFIARASVIGLLQIE
jgi:hypothetical protein